MNALGADAVKHNRIIAQRDTVGTSAKAVVEETVYFIAGNPQLVKIKIDNAPAFRTNQMGMTANRTVKTGYRTRLSKPENQPILRQRFKNTVNRRARNGRTAPKPVENLIGCRMIFPRNQMTVNRHPLFGNRQTAGMTLRFEIFNRLIGKNDGFCGAGFWSGHGCNQTVFCEQKEKKTETASILSLLLNEILSHLEK